MGADQAAMAHGSLQTFFRPVHNAIGIQKLIASEDDAVIATNDEEVAMMCCW